MRFNLGRFCVQTHYACSIYLYRADLVESKTRETFKKFLHAKIQWASIARGSSQRDRETTIVDAVNDV